MYIMGEGDNLTPVKGFLNFLNNKLIRVKGLLSKVGLVKPLTEFKPIPLLIKRRGKHMMDRAEFVLRDVERPPINSLENLAIFLGSSLGLFTSSDPRELQFFLTILRNKEVTAEDLIRATSYSKPVVYNKLKIYQRRGIIYRSRGGIYKLRERTLKDTIDYRLREDVEKLLDRLVKVAEELDKEMKKAETRKKKLSVTWTR